MDNLIAQKYKLFVEFNRVESNVSYDIFIDINMQLVSYLICCFSQPGLRVKCYKVLLW